jgi:uncharacterized protein YecT (DUF1311 family)
VALAVALAWAAPPAAAQENADEGVRDVETEDQAGADLAFLRQCLETLASRGAPARVCIDIVSRGCASEPGGDTTTGAVACFERERNAWQALMTEAATALEQAMSNTERERFAAAQEAWGAFRDAQCAYESSLFEDGSLAGVERTACERRIIAERTIAIHDRAAYIAEQTGER